MKTRIALFFITLSSICLTTNAQVKIFDDNWISLGSLQKGGFGFHVTPNGYSYFKPSVMDNILGATWFVPQMMFKKIGLY